MKVYYGSKGSEFFIMCADFKEIYAFDTFGNLSRVNGIVDSCNNWQEVDFLSFVGIGTNNCELLYNGYKSELGIPLLEGIKPFRLRGGYLGTLFNVPHEDNQGRFTQIVIVFPTGFLCDNYINNLFPNRNWIKLSSY